MKIHIIRTGEVEDTLFLGVSDFLDRHPGPARFIFHEKLAELREEEIEKQEWEDEDLFVQMVCCEMVNYSTRSVIGWDHLFEVCRDFRDREAIPEEEAVILLNGITNDRNWFSAGAPDGLDFFVQTNDWNLYVDGDSRYPVVYQLFAMALMATVYPSYRDYVESAHRKARGCIHDFCQDKREIGLKLRTADICPDCIRKMEAGRVDPLMIRQAVGAMEDIRSQMLSREKLRISGKTLSLRIEGRSKRFFLPELGNLEIHLTPMEKTVYLFFLNHPEGVLFNYMSDHYAELRHIYGQVSNTGAVSKLEERARALSVNRDDCLSQVFSRIRRKFEEVIGEDLAEPLIISGEAGQKRRILIDRPQVQMVN